MALPMTSGAMTTAASLSYAFRLPPGPGALAYAQLAERLGYDRIWSPGSPSVCHDIRVHLARIGADIERELNAFARLVNLHPK